MMGPLEIILFAVLVLLSATVSTSEPGRVHKVTPPSSIPLPLNDETVITCEMNLIPDKFQWRFFPLGKSQASNPNAPLNLSATNYIDLPPSNYKYEKKKSTLTVKLSNSSMAGDYQCLAHYGASVIASVPDRITITTLENFPVQNNTYINVSPGNTVVWRCAPPYSNPPAYIDYSKDGSYVQQSGASPTFLIIPNVSKKDSGTYKCRATNTLQQKAKDSNCGLHLNIVDTNNEPPRFIVQPQSTYTITNNERVFLECGAVGTPVPKVTWEKLSGELDKSRMQLLPGGLQILSGTSNDEGVYVCKHENSKGSISHKITLIYNQEPRIISGPNSTHIKEGEELDLECLAEGTPEPKISWILNGKGVLNDNQIEAVGNRIYFTPFEKRHAGIIQCFASNQIGTTYSSADLEVIPKQISSTNVVEDLSTSQPAPTHKHRKHKNKYKHKGTSEMIPPSKPTISRVNDESVVVRWSVPSNDGLPIQFFKVQYKELGPTNSENPSGGKSRWKTTNMDIAPNIRSYEVNNLKPDFIYKFRIAAVYSNNDNKLSKKSDKFHLIRADFFARNPLPIPTLTHTESVNDTSIRIFWEYTPDPNVTVDGFFINYMSASSAGDYMKATVDGEKTNSYVITHLVPDTVYDIKMQSFNSKTAGEFSSILKEKTEKITTESPVTTTVKNKQSPEAHSSDSEMYIFIGAGIFVAALLLSVVVLLIICRKWKQNKDTDGNRGGDRGDKVDEINHHIQAEANDYVVTPKNMGRNNGCALPQNRITITANPLADADNKSQNMIEMSCLTAQNNNCNPSASNQDQQQPSKHKNRENKRRKNNSESQPGENYV